MYHAEALLCETNLKVSEISRRVGISNSQYFRRIFQEFTGQSPNDYRKQLLLRSLNNILSFKTIGIWEDFLFPADGTNPWREPTFPKISYSQ